jgi:hypothetical protein
VIILILLEEKYKLWSSSLCSFLQPPPLRTKCSPQHALLKHTQSSCSLSFSEQVKVGLWAHHAVCVSVHRLPYQLLNAWTNIYETWYVYHGPSELRIT